MIGTVKSYDARRGAGQIASEDGPDIFVHSSEVERAGLARLAPGDRLNFDIQTDRALGRTFAVNLRAL